MLAGNIRDRNAITVTLQHKLRLHMFRPPAPASWTRHNINTPAVPFFGTVTSYVILYRIIHKNPPYLDGSFSKIQKRTSTRVVGRRLQSESTFSYFGALEAYLHEHGRPVAFYSDKHSVFRVASQGAETGHGMTQFGRALNELNIEILCANSSQAKGRVERANRTLQDRLVKELRLAGISDMDAANAFLPAFRDHYNKKFAKPPRRPDNLHRPLNTEPDRLADVLCWRDERYVGNQLAFSYDRQRIILQENEITRGLPGKYVDRYEFPDGRLEFRWKGVSLPYSVFDKDQRVTHAAITENKHLSAVLEHIKAEQDKATPKKPRAGKQRSRYKPTGRRNDGWNSKLARAAAEKCKARAAICEVSALAGIAPPQRQSGTVLLCEHGDISTWLQQRT